MGPWTTVFCALALCWFVQAQGGASYDWTFPDGEELSQTILIGLAISISWDSDLQSWFASDAPAADVTNVDLWITDYDGDGFSHQIGTGIDVSDAGTFPWTVEVPSSELAITNEWIFCFIASNETVADSTGQVSSPGFYISDDTSASTTAAGTTPSSTMPSGTTPSSTATSSTKTPSTASSSTATSSTTTSITTASGTSTSAPESSTESSSLKTAAAAITSAQNGAATTGISASSSAEPTVSPTLSTDAKIGIAIGASAGAFILLGAGWFLARRRQKRNYNSAQVEYKYQPAPGYGGTESANEKRYPSYIGPEIPSHRAELDFNSRVNLQHFVEVDGHSHARGPP